MKVRVITAEDTVKQCPKCEHDIFRKSTKSRYTNQEHTKGITYELQICDNCNHREQYNEREWVVVEAKAYDKED